MCLFSIVLEYRSEYLILQNSVSCRAHHFFCFCPGSMFFAHCFHSIENAHRFLNQEIICSFVGTINSSEMLWNSERLIRYLCSFHSPHQFSFGIQSVPKKDAHLFHASGISRVSTNGQLWFSCTSSTSLSSQFVRSFLVRTRLQSSQQEIIQNVWNPFLDQRILFQKI